MNPFPTHLSRRLGLVALLLLSGACSHATSELAAGAIGNVVQSPGVADLVLPLDAYLPGPDESIAIDTARNVLTQTCMEAKGFEFPIPDRSGARRNLNEKRYGVIDARNAEQFGYKSEPNPAEERHRAWRAAQPDLTAAAQAALFGPAPRPGVAPEGCLGEANAQLSTDDDGIRFVEELAHETWERSFADERVAAAHADWSDCMKGAGYEYEDPMDAIDDPRFGGNVATSLERIVATADVTCKGKTNVAGIWLAVETAYQNSLIDKHSERLHEIQERKDDVVRLAATALDQHNKTTGER